jgi:uncharacterized protein (UPF0147 family)
MIYAPRNIRQVADEADLCIRKQELADLLETAEEECLRACMVGDICGPIRRNKTRVLKTFRNIVKIAQDSTDTFSNTRCRVVNALRSLSYDILNNW